MTWPLNTQFVICLEYYYYLMNSIFQSAYTHARGGGGGELLRPRHRPTNRHHSRHT